MKSKCRDKKISSIRSLRLAPAQTRRPRAARVQLLESFGPATPTHRPETDPTTQDEVTPTLMRSTRSPS